ncbi:MAG: folylpolyglutamate synthase/dihydrofolate synthase family protein [Chloroflexota bacterium]|jgi:dihydrofolate synthase/folylpolyglutamate synthase
MNQDADAYQQTLDYLYGFVDYSLTRNFQYSPENFNLDRMTKLVAGLDHPERKYPVIHIAGTKGKGSTGAMIAAGLQAAGYKTGFYISPHLEDFCERIQINREHIPAHRLVEIVAQMKPLIEKFQRLTTFELTTAAGFLYFAQEQVDIAVIEVGLGGRLDSTNVVQPLVSVITSISLDHTQILGDTVDKIAAEKAGIIKPYRPVVVSAQKPEAFAVIQDIARQRNAPLFHADEQYQAVIRERNLEYQCFSILPKKDLTENAVEVKMPLLGDHQVENALTAWTALKIVREQGVVLSNEDILRGLAKVEWQARFEVIHQNPTIVADSAHNRDSALKLMHTVKSHFPDNPIVVIFGASDDKDIEGMFAEILPHVSQLILTRSVHPRSCVPEKLEQMASEYGIPTIVRQPLEMAVEEALRMLTKDHVLLATGSIFVAAGARKFVRQMFKPAPLDRLGNE